MVSNGGRYVLYEFLSENATKINNYFLTNAAMRRINKLGQADNRQQKPSGENVIKRLLLTFGCFYLSVFFTEI